MSRKSLGSRLYQQNLLWGRLYSNGRTVLPKIVQGPSPLAISKFHQVFPPTPDKNMYLFYTKSIDMSQKMSKM